MQTLQKTTTRISVFTWTLIIGFIIGVIITCMCFITSIKLPTDVSRRIELMFLAILAGGFIGSLATLFVMLVISMFSSSAWFCHSYGMHPSKDILLTHNDGYRDYGQCERCGKNNLKQDATGNWYGWYPHDSFTPFYTEFFYIKKARP